MDAATTTENTPRKWRKQFLDEQLNSPDLILKYQTEPNQ